MGLEAVEIRGPVNRSALTSSGSREEAGIEEARAVLRFVETWGRPDEKIAHLGLLGTEARPVLEKYRRERHLGAYWPATAGLAISGDAAARAEFLAMLREDRISLYDQQWDDTGFTLNGDPEVMEHWLSRVGSNCCLWYYAWEALRRWYPTMPAENTVGDPDGLETKARAWWARWKDHLRWNPLFGCWLPAAE